jgi:hypothetical protein
MLVDLLWYLDPWCQFSGARFFVFCYICRRFRSVVCGCIVLLVAIVLFFLVWVTCQAC